MVIKLRSLWEKLASKPVPDTLEVTCQRFFQVFHQHGVETTQIPRLLPQLKLDDLQSSQKLLAVLTPALLDQVAALFNVRVQWLEGIDEEIYDYLGWYKNPIDFLEHLKGLIRNSDTKYDHPVRVLCTTKQLDYRTRATQELAFVLLEKVAELGDEEIYRYFVYRDGGSWDYYTYRIEAKAVARIIFKRLGIPVTLFEMPKREMDDLLEGRFIPAGRLRGCLLSNPSLEDYALAKNESGVAKETEELEAVLLYIDEQGLSNFSFERYPTPENTDQVASVSKNDNEEIESLRANAVKAANKKHERTNNIKQRFIQFYRDHGDVHKSKAEAARTFFRSDLIKADQLQFKNEETACRALLEALRKAPS